MTYHPDNSTVGLLLSGGLDSGILLGYLLDEGYRVKPFYVDSGLHWQPAELAATRRFLAAVDSPNVAELTVLELPLSDVYGEHWSVSGRGIPDEHTPDEAVYLPGRNALLTIKAAIWCSLHNVDRLALAVLKANPFADASAEFFGGFQSALNLATGGKLEIWRPFSKMDKREVMRLGSRLPLELTFSCIAPADGLHCGRCNKCAERIAAFRSIDADDPTPYADLASVSANRTNTPNR